MGQNEVTLVDTSSWIEALRLKGQENIRERVKLLLIDGLAAWCDMVAVELWNGAKGDYEKKRLAELEKEIVCLPTTDKVWSGACELARKSRNAGHTIPPADLIIASCAIFHGVEIEHCDTHFDVIIAIHNKSY
jgi:predicted nucleic acid-binding protein